MNGKMVLIKNSPSDQLVEENSLYSVLLVTELLKFQKGVLKMVNKLLVVNQTNNLMNSGNSFHALIKNMLEKMLITLDHIVVKHQMFVKEKLKKIKLLFNGITMDKKIKSGLFNHCSIDFRLNFIYLNFFFKFTGFNHSINTLIISI